MSFDRSAARRAAPQARIALAAALALSPFAVQAQEEKAAEAPAAAPAAEAAAPEIDPALVLTEPKASDVIAVIDGEEITLGQLLVLRSELPDQYQNAPADQLVDALLRRLSVEVAFARKAEEAGLQDSAEMKTRAAVQRRARLAEAWMRQVIEGAATEEAIAAAYETQVAAAPEVEEVKASHILVPEEEKAAAIKAEIEAGAAFADKAAEHGTDGTKDRGGDLGWFAHGQMVPEFADAAFGAEEGALVGPVQTQFGWHLIHVTGKRVQPKPTLEEVRPQLAEAVAREAAQAAIREAAGAAQTDMKAVLANPELLRDDSLLRAE